MSPDPTPDPWEMVSTLPMGQRIRILRNGAPLAEGTLVPSSAFSGDRIVQIKLASGYNSGIRLEPHDQFEVIGELPAKAIPLTADEGTMSRGHRSAPTGPWIALLTTGGTDRVPDRLSYRRRATGQGRRADPGLLSRSGPGGADPHPTGVRPVE